MTEYVKEQRARVESRRLLNDFDTLPNWHLRWFFELYANQKRIKAPVSPQSLQWWVLIIVFHFARRVDGKDDIFFFLLMLFLKMVQFFFIFTQHRRAALTLCVPFITERYIF